MAVGYQRAGQIDLALPWAEKAVKKIDRPAVHMAFGGLLLAAGVLIATLSGLCSLAFLANFISEKDGNLVDMLEVAAVFGGPPLAVGVGLMIGGRAILKKARRRSAIPSPREAEKPPEA